MLNPTAIPEDAALARRLVGEFLGSAFLAAIVIGSGFAAQQLSPGHVGLELLENAIATGAGLFVLCVVFGPLSGAHFNPVVSFVDAAFGGLSLGEACAYTLSQVAGCFVGAIVANVMFDGRALSLSTHSRATGPHDVAEIVATAGLVLVIFSLSRNAQRSHIPAAVGLYITAAYFFTSSTSFANPAITVGRMFSNSFAGIAPGSAPSFILAEVAGAALGYLAVRTLFPQKRESS